MSHVENGIQRAIELAIGAEPDLIVLRNNVGVATHTNEKTGKTYRTAYGLGTGSPDLVGILAPAGRWFCLEIKAPGEVPRPEQHICHRAWRKFGAFVAAVDSVASAREALARARAGAFQ